MVSKTFDEKMIEEHKHPTHRRTTAIAIASAAAVGALGAVILMLARDRPDSPHALLCGIIMFGLGCLGFIFSGLWAGLIVRCPQCRAFIFRWGDSYPKEKTFHCKQCNVNWNIGVVVGGPD
jgi:hypothetical protein